MPNAFLDAEWLPLKKTDSDPFSLATRLFCGRALSEPFNPGIIRRALRDRYNILNKYSPYNFEDVADPFPQSCAASLSDLLDMRAVELLRKHTRIAVSWSGGIDSTAAVVALLKHLPRTEHHRLTLISTESAKCEAPEFYQLLVSLGITVVFDNALFTRLGNVDCDVVVTAFGADSLFGSNTFLSVPFLYSEHPYAGIKQLWEIGNPTSRLTHNEINSIVDVFNDYAEQLGLRISTFAEFAWLFGIGCRITLAYAHTKLFLAGYKNCNKAVSFFEPAVFTDWAFSDFGNVNGANRYASPCEYKRPLREYIYEFDKCERYLNEKTKCNSLLPVSDFPLNECLVSSSSGVVRYKPNPDEDSGAFMERMTALHRK